MGSKTAESNSVWLVVWNIKYLFAARVVANRRAMHSVYLVALSVRTTRPYIL